MKSESSVVLFHDHPVGQCILGGGSSHYYCLDRAIGEHARDEAYRTDLVNGLLEALRASGVCEEEDTHNIVQGTGWAVLMWGRGSGRQICGLVQFLHKPIGKGDLGGSSACD